MRLLLSLLGIFVIAQLIGIYTGLIIINDLTKNPYVGGLVVTTDSEDPFNAVFFIAYILFGAALMIILIRFFGMVPIIFVLMEFFLISSASSIVFYAVARSAIGYEASTIIGIIAGLAFSAAKQLMPQLKNAAAVLATAGVGVIFGISLDLVPLILFLIMLSLYDFISVFKTRHMVEMANFIVSRDMAFTITAKAPPAAPGQKEQRIDLGTGDIIAPIMLEVAVLPLGPAATGLVFVGAVASLGIFLGAVWKKKMVLPALPPIVLGMIISLVLGFLLGLF